MAIRNSAHSASEPFSIGLGPEAMVSIRWTAPSGATSLISIRSAIVLTTERCAYLLQRANRVRSLVLCPFFPVRRDGFRTDFNIRGLLGRDGHAAIGKLPGQA